MKALVDLTSWNIEWFEDENGKKWQIEGECNVNKCKAACCELNSGYCNNLDDNFKCKLVTGGAVFRKPMICFLYPWKQSQIESKCSLRLIPYGNNE